MSTAVPVFYRCIPEFVTLDPDLHPFASYLFVVIAHKAFLDSGKVQMTNEELANLSRLSVSTVLRYVPELEAKGYLKVHRARLGSKIPNTYQIIGLAAEIVVRKSKVEAAPAALPQPLWQNPAGKATSQTQLSERHSAFLNRPYPGKTVTAEDYPTDTRPPTSHDTAAKIAVPELPQTHQVAKIAVSEKSEAPLMADNPPTDNPQIPEISQANAPNTPSVSAALPAPLPEITHDLSDRQLTTQQETETNEHRVEYVVNTDSTPLYKLPGMAPELMQQLIEYYGAARVEEVLTALESRKKHIANPVGWVIKALEKGWEFKNAAHKNAQRDPDRYFKGRYAEYIHH